MVRLGVRALDHKVRVRALDHMVRLGVRALDHKVRVRVGLGNRVGFLMAYRYAIVYNYKV